MIDAPFSVEIDSPTIGHLGQVFYVNMKVTNKLDSLEKMHIGVDMCDDFVATGPSSQILEVPTLFFIIRVLVVDCLTGRPA